MRYSKGHRKEKNMMKQGLFLSDIGYIIYEYKDDRLYHMRIEQDVDLCACYENHLKIDHQLGLYFRGLLTTFELAISFDKGTDFQIEVWRELLKIPYGQTRSYQDIASRINRPKSVRAVGQACKKNPIGIVVPCHRVIGKNGSLTGYSGKGFLHLKQSLLDIEKKRIS